MSGPMHHASLRADAERMAEHARRRARAAEAKGHIRIARVWRQQAAKHELRLAELEKQALGKEGSHG